MEITRKSSAKHLSKAVLAIAGTAFLLCGGCNVQGLSGPGKTTTLGYDLTELKERKSNKQVRLPLHLVLAQAGALQPDRELVETLSNYPSLFRKISVIPAAPEIRDFSKEVKQRDPEELLKLSDQLGGDLLLLVGGQIDSTNGRTPASVLDLTIVGNYVAPTNKININAQALAVAISVHERRLIMTTTESIDRSRLATSASRHTKEETLIRQTRSVMLKKIGQSFAQKIADASGVVLKKNKHKSTPKDNDKPKPENDKKVATVYIASDGFHLSLFLPTNHSNKKSYVEIGLGERNWAMGKNWRWLNGIMAATTHNEGIAVVEYMGTDKTAKEMANKKRLWKIELTAAEWGEMLNAIESELRLQEVLLDNHKGYRVVKTSKGYNLFHNCHHFALNPLGKTAKQLSGGFPKPTPILEKHLDMIFGKKAR